jgi:hypothetical protein
MFSRYKVLAAVGLAVLCGVVSFSNLPDTLTRAQEQAKLLPSAKVDLGGSKVNGFVFTADGKFALIAVSVGRESSVFLVAASTTDTAKFYGQEDPRLPHRRRDLPSADPREYQPAGFSV